MPLFRHHVDYLGMNSEEICFIHVLNQMMHSEFGQEKLHQQVHQCPASSKNPHRPKPKTHLSMLTLKPMTRARSSGRMWRVRTTELSHGESVAPIDRSNLIKGIVPSHSCSKSYSLLGFCQFPVFSHMSVPSQVHYWSSDGGASIPMPLSCSVPSN